MSLKDTIVPIRERANTNDIGSSFQYIISVWTFLPNLYGSREKAEKFLENEEKHP